MRTVLGSSAVVVVAGLAACLASGCHSMTPRVEVAPVVFAHPEEIRRESGETDGYWVMADRRVFAVMAFLNAAGYDEEAPSYRMHPLRMKVRQKVAENLAGHPEELDRWRQYYRDHFMGSWKYANYALSLTADYPFRPIRPATELHDTWIAPMLADFPEVLNRFWVTARLDQVWAEVRPDYEAELGHYNVRRMADEMAFLWRYLKMARKDSYIIIQVPNPLQRSATASANRFEHYFYSVDGPDSNGGGLNVHEYLHTFVNDLVRAHYGARKGKLRPYYDAGKDAAISRTLGDPISWCSECLVHALDHRITVLRLTDPALKQRVEADVDALTRGGYTLLKPLYQALADFERSEQPLNQYLPVLLDKLPSYSSTQAYENHLTTAQTQ